MRFAATAPAAGAFSARRLSARNRDGVFSSIKSRTDLSLSAAFLNHRLGALNGQQRIGVAMQHLPRPILQPVNRRDAKRHRHFLFASGQADSAPLEINAVRQFRGNDEGDIFKLYVAAFESGGRPFIALFDLLVPSAFVSA